MEFVTENELGIAKDTKLEDAVEMNFDGETKEAGLYFAMARQAQREGYPEIAEVLKRIALEELDHASRFAELNAKIGATKENLEQMLRGEQGANRAKHQAAMKAKEKGIDTLSGYFEESAKDEARHATMLKGLLDRYFG
ncbi:ferritin-like domain-containing protein [Halonatronum saccharophilum]|uniref:ferritin-like domain-containing protein n=1 Tax=Halonatronum saccharophilum TaxID=150060 RepID=UPI000480B217|nr:ferritin family protein [Halonatronum saccharophilum]